MIVARKSLHEAEVCVILHCHSVDLSSLRIVSCCGRPESGKPLKTQISSNEINCNVAIRSNEPLSTGSENGQCNSLKLYSIEEVLTTIRSTQFHSLLSYQDSPFSAFHRRTRFAIAPSISCITKRPSESLPEKRKLSTFNATSQTSPMHFFVTRVSGLTHERRALS